MNDGIDSGMLQKTTLAFNTAEPMSSEGINMTSTMVTDVGLTVVYPERDQQLPWLCDRPFI